MPYKSNTDLPDSVSSHLPQEAQTIYRKAFNAAYEEYMGKATVQGRSVDEVAARVAWAAVKKIYEKSAEGEWVKK